MACVVSTNSISAGGDATTTIAYVSINPDVSYRSEAFGALCYRFSSRELFLISSSVVIPLLDALQKPKDEMELIAELGHVTNNPAQVVSALAALTKAGVIFRADKTTNIGERDDD